MEHSKRSRGRTGRLVMMVATFILAGCSLDGLLNKDQIPPNVTDPAVTKTPAGAQAAYVGTQAQFRNALNSFVSETGLLSDELRTGSSLGTLSPSSVDIRNMPEDQYNSAAYRPLQQVRAQAGQAIGLLTQYAPEQRALVGQAYVLEGYAEDLLAELFCSGIPLSTVDFNGDYTVKPGSTTEQVLTHAIALFDTALTFAGDSARFMHLAALGKGRALLGLGEYAAAAAAVATVPDAYRYEVSYSAATGAAATNFGKNFSGLWTYSVADREGGNGLDYVTSADPRVPTILQGTNGKGYTVYRPTKYDTNGASPILLASGVEARLIEAEAALQAGNVPGWLNLLNQLRTSSAPIPPDTIADTLGVTGCGPALCGESPGGSEPWQGQPAGGFQVPTGYVLTDSVLIDPVSDEIFNDCYNNSWYEPCYVDGDNPQHGQTVVYLYVKAGQSGGAGIGGVAGLAALTDPGTAAGRVDLMFRERAFWLFLTGHRQGDLRRLIRQYDRFPEQIYPIGDYPGGYYYGGDVTEPLAPSERVSNPLFTGCTSRGA